MTAEERRSMGISLDCRDGQHQPACAVCDCWCHDATVERVADAIVRTQAARLDGFAVGLADLSPDGRADAFDDARAALAAVDGAS